MGYSGKCPLIHWVNSSSTRRANTVSSWPGNGMVGRVFRFIGTIRHRYEERGRPNARLEPFDPHRVRLSHPKRPRAQLLHPGGKHHPVHLPATRNCFCPARPSSAPGSSAAATCWAMRRIGRNSVGGFAEVGRWTTNSAGTCEATCCKTVCVGLDAGWRSCNLEGEKSVSARRHRVTLSRSRLLELRVLRDARFAVSRML